MARVTQKDFLKAVDLLREAMGQELEVNMWHKHLSIYTKGPNGNCQEKIIQAETTRAAIEQVWAILNAIHILNKGENK